LKFAIRFSLRDILWLTTVIALATGWLLAHRASFKSAEAARSQLWDAQHSAEFFLEGSQENRCRAEALKAVLEYERTATDAKSVDRLVWSRSAGPLAFDFDIYLTDQEERIWVKPQDAVTCDDGMFIDGMLLKPTVNCVGLVLVHSRGHIAESTGLMNILPSPPTGWVAPTANAIHVNNSKTRVRLTLPERMRDFLGAGRHHIAIYGGWRKDPTSSSASSEKLDTNWTFFLVRPLSIAP
jgi:hypothetical protein